MYSPYAHVTIRMYLGEEYISTVSRVYSKKGLKETILAVLENNRRAGLSGLRTNVMVRDEYSYKLIKWAN